MPGMRMVGASVVVGLGALLAASCASGRLEAPTTAYVNAFWWTGAQFEYGDRYVRNGVFVQRPTRSVAARVDLGGDYASPAFGEAHNHITGPSSNDAFLGAGVFYVQNPNILASVSAELKPFYAKPGTIDGVMAMGGLTGPGGHPVPLYTDTLRRFVYTKMTAEQMYGDAFHVVARRDDIAPALATLDRQGADFVKIYLLGSERFGQAKAAPDDATGLDPALAPEIVKQAHRRGWKVMAHVETAADFRTAVAAGVDEMAHMPGYGAPPDDPARYRLSPADARAAAKGGVKVITTSWLGGERVKADAQRRTVIQALQRDNVRTLTTAGVPILMGSDAGPQGAVNEAVYLTQIGALSAREAFRSLSIVTPQSIFPKRRIGRLRPGYEADFVTLAADPTRDITAVKRVRRRVMAGVPVEPVPAKPAVAR